MLTECICECRHQLNGIHLDQQFPKYIPKQKASHRRDKHTTYLLTAGLGQVLTCMTLSSLTLRKPSHCHLINAKTEVQGVYCLVRDIKCHGRDRI